MAKDSKTIWHTIDTQIYYAQVFEENRDQAEMFEDTDGVTKVTLKVTEDDIATLKGFGVPESALGYDTFKEKTIDGETFMTFVVKRPWVSKWLKDDNGEPLVMGAPVVFDYNKAVEAYTAAGATGVMGDDYITPWTIQDGLIGNGSSAKVRISIYRGKNKAGKATCVVTLEKIAITELVPYEGNSDGGIRF